MPRRWKQPYTSNALRSPLHDIAPPLTSAAQLPVTPQRRATCRARAFRTIEAKLESRSSGDCVARQLDLALTAFLAPPNWGSGRQ